MLSPVSLSCDPSHRTTEMSCHMLNDVQSQPGLCSSILHRDSAVVCVLVSPCATVASLSCRSCSTSVVACPLTPPRPCCARGSCGPTQRRCRHQRRYWPRVSWGSGCAWWVDPRPCLLDQTCKAHHTHMFTRQDCVAGTDERTWVQSVHNRDCMQGCGDLVIVRCMCVCVCVYTYQ